MPEVNDEWIKEQLEAAKVKVGSGKAILSLLEAWKKIPKLSGPMTEEALTVFSSLARGHNIKEDENEDDMYVWIQLQPGQVTVAGVVRVK